jgi:hypothetical protein
MLYVAFQWLRERVSRKRPGEITPQGTPAE